MSNVKDFIHPGGSIHVLYCYQSGPTSYSIINSKSIYIERLFIARMKNNGPIVLLSVLSVLVIGATLNAADAVRVSAVVAYLPSADASQGPRYITFESVGDCHQYVKENNGLYDKSDCQKGTPPEEPPTEP